MLDSRVILCSVNVSTNSLFSPKFNSRIRFALITPADLEKKRVLVSFEVSSVRRHHYSSKIPLRDKRGPVGEVKLLEMHLLNLKPLDEVPKHFG